MNKYLADRSCLAWFQQPATPRFWDAHWQIVDLRSYLTVAASDGIFVPAVCRHLPQGSLVLEGGCGRGQLVRMLEVNGYRAIGVDFAEQTIDAIRRAMPGLDVRVGDVRALPIPDEVLDGYISVGVIEHFWDGYAAILAEMRRTLRPGGYLFLSFPYMSLLRRAKVLLQAYPTALKADYPVAPADFYQFALPAQQVIDDLVLLGFECVEKRPFDGIKGVKDEIGWLKPSLQAVYDGKRAEKLRPWLDRCFRRFGAHSVLLVMRKQ